MKKRDEFIRHMTEGLPDRPANIARIVAINQGAFPLTLEEPEARPIAPAEASRWMEENPAIQMIDMQRNRRLRPGPRSRGDQPPDLQRRIRAAGRLGLRSRHPVPPSRRKRPRRPAGVAQVGLCGPGQQRSGIYRGRNAGLVRRGTSLPYPLTRSPSRVFMSACTPTPGTVGALSTCVRTRSGRKGTSRAPTT